MVLHGLAAEQPFQLAHPLFQAADLGSRNDFIVGAHRLLAALAHQLPPQTRLGDSPWRRATIADRHAGLHRRSTDLGYRRIAALLKRERRSAGLPPVNAKRVYRLMKKHGLLLERHTGRWRPREHDGHVATIVDPQAWLADVLARIAEHPARGIDELLPWNWRPRSAPRRWAA